MPVLARFNARFTATRGFCTFSKDWVLQTLQNAKVTFALRDFEGLKCIEAVVDGSKPLRAAERLGHDAPNLETGTPYAVAGPAALISPASQPVDAVADRVIELLRSTYADFGPTLATENLRTMHGIDLAKETVGSGRSRAVCGSRGRLSPFKIQQPRMRRACIGEVSRSTAASVWLL